MQFAVSSNVETCKINDDQQEIKKDWKESGKAEIKQTVDWDGDATSSQEI